ncbi:MAG: phosphoglycerate kinase [Candidatus Bathyarchaeia archaeon]|jgi:phosphoglycerate kinase|nr:phosphoglycerate kinase [Candidatus Bathyarchaeota archaeon A05DMB-4]MDH7594827.1 phosphoglycerate kinase [Candidatus Bathyarchaeota archaeon]
MAKFLTMDDFNFENKTALVRVDFNSNIDPQTKKILEAPRIRSHGETTIKELVQKGAKVVILAHQGRPGDPDFAPLKQHAEILSKVLGKPVQYVDDLFGEKAQNAIRQLKRGEILVLENVRTYPDELKKGTPEEHAKSEFVQKLAPLADVFVSDAFAAAHRAQISIVGFTAVLPSIAGRIMERELKALTKAVENPEKPCVYILGGAKADDALKISQYVLKNNIADHVLTGGVVGHLFLAAKGVNLGKPNMDFLQKKELTGFVPGIKALIQEYPERIQTPIDVAVEVGKKRKEISVKQLPTEHPIFDIGTETIAKYSKIIKNAKSIVFSGPVGVFENDEFATGTRKIFEAIATSKAYSLIGGGDTVSAAEKFSFAKKMSYVSTAGGALIEFLMGEKLPGVVALEKAATRKL